MEIKNDFIPCQIDKDECMQVRKMKLLFINYSKLKNLVTRENQRHAFPKSAYTTNVGD